MLVLSSALYLCHGWMGVMSLGSVLHTAVTGMSAATATVDAVSDNLANSRTNGFKASRPVFATQPPGTYSASGNSVQVGTGVQVIGIATDYSQGPLVAASGSDGNESNDSLEELSNTDIGENLVDLVLASEQFLANANVSGTADQLLDELIHLGRSQD